jgi:hypothetical protein
VPENQVVQDGGVSSRRWLERWSARLDHGFFVAAGGLAVWLAYLTFREGIVWGWQLLLLVVFWVLVAYLVLPRVHRILTGVYLPDYFIGRTRTADGLLGDPVNIGLRGTAAQVHEVMTAAGWTKAEAVTPASSWRIVVSTLTRRSYPSAPVSPLLLFRRQQDFAYQQEVAGSPSKRHHVRFWRCPQGWLLPGGFRVDWLAAGTYDRSVGLSLFTLQVTHKIEAEVDTERDYILSTVRHASPEASVSVLEDFSTGYHSRNGGGDVIKTDGDLPIIDVTAVSAAREEPTGAAETDVLRRPMQTWFGAAATALRGLSLVWLGVAVHLGATTVVAVPAADTPVVAVMLLVFGFIDLGLAVAAWLGSNAARLTLIVLSLWGVVTVLVSRAVENDHEPLHAGLFPIAISVLMLLALSSAPARLFAAQFSR